MGACVSGNVTEEEKLARKKNKDIEYELQADRKRLKEEVKILLLGTPPGLLALGGPKGWILFLLLFFLPVRGLMTRVGNGGVQERESQARAPSSSR